MFHLESIYIYICFIVTYVYIILYTYVYMYIYIYIIHISCICIKVLYLNWCTIFFSLKPTGHTDIFPHEAPAAEPLLRPSSASCGSHDASLWGEASMGTSLGGSVTHLLV